MMKKEVRSHVPEHAKSMAGTVREAYWEVPGKARDRPFSRRGAKASTEGSREGSRRIFHDFGSPLGAPWGTILAEKCGFKVMRKIDAKRVSVASSLGRGRRQGCGSLGLQNLQICTIV